VPTFRYYRLDSDDHVTATGLIECETDNDALARADVLLAASDDAGIEVYDCNGRVLSASNAACDKLYAAACHDLGDAADLSADYLEACARWYADLSPQERATAAAAVAAFDLGHESEGAAIAGMLPPAPVFPP
jgi:hypothetical protein